MTTEELLNKLSKKYPSPAYAFLRQVRNQTGYGYKAGTIRTADAMALGLWKSRGYYLHGFELKISRSDWLHELKEPAKAEAIAEYCDMFSLVISDIKIIDVSEVPKTWGIMVAQNGSVKTFREAPLNKDVKCMDRPFLCGFMRNITEQIERIYTPTVEVNEIIKDRVKNEVEYKLKSVDDRAFRYEKLIEKLKIFDKASGINLEGLDYEWNKPEAIGEAVNIVLNGNWKRVKQNLEIMKEDAKQTLKSAMEELKKIENYEKVNLSTPLKEK